MDALIIRPGALGDTLMALPAVVHLLGRVSITFVGRRPGIDFIRDCVALALDIEGQGWHRLFLEAPDPKGLPLPYPPGLVAGFLRDRDGRFQHNLNAYFPGVPVYLFPAFPKPSNNTHVARYVSECLSSAGLPVDPPRAVQEAMDSALLNMTPGGSIRRDYWVFHPGSGGLGKNHPPDFWKALLEKVSKEPGLESLRPTVLLGPAEEPFYDYFKEVLGPYHMEPVWCPDNAYLQVLLKEASLYVGQDSGITHLAAMLGTPTLALFKGSDPCTWSPLGPAVRVINRKETNKALVEEVVRNSRELLLSGK